MRWFEVPHRFDRSQAPPRCLKERNLNTQNGKLIKS